jgi:hypothetical protein
LRGSRIYQPLILRRARDDDDRIERELRGRKALLFVAGLVDERASDRNVGDGVPRNVEIRLEANGPFVHAERLFREREPPLRLRGVADSVPADAVRERSVGMRNGSAGV